MQNPIFTLTIILLTALCEDIFFWKIPVWKGKKKKERSSYIIFLFSGLLFMIMKINFYYSEEKILLLAPTSFS